jgi:phosphoglycolate phosphatase-like HAD superfamily hydrolase
MTDSPAPLASWNDGPAKSAVLAFVDRATERRSRDYVPPSERIAVFDNDGTLWAEQPMYAQMAFAINRIRELSPKHPEWKRQQPFKGILEGDLEVALAGGERAISELIAASHAGMTTDEFEQIVQTWLTEARHPRFHRPYDDLVYQPMLELIQYLSTNDFRVYVVSGGGIDFMRVWAEKAYGLPRSHVIGSSIETTFAMRQGEPVLMRKPDLDFIDDAPGKPVAIHRFVGMRPIAAFGNADGDLEMLEWTTAGSGARLAVLVHHTDAEREWAYDRDAKTGRLDKALDRARRKSWTVVDMKRDWRRIFPFDAPSDSG